jgi:multidrug resistance efflux pump
MSDISEIRSETLDSTKNKESTPQPKSKKSSSIKSEFNNKRKAQRFHIPIFVVIDGKSYQTSDWSMTGIGIIFHDDFRLVKNDEVKAQLILPFSDANINLKIKLVVRNIHKSICGFEILEISEKNKRVLRHFMTMVLEGNADKFEDLVSDLNMPVVETPINESILLAEAEEKALKDKFTFKAVVYMILGFVLFVSVVVTSLYNFFVVYQSKGIIFGNYDTYNIEVSAKLEDIFVASKDIVSTGKTLFKLDSYNVENKLQIENQKLKSLQDKYIRLKKSLESDLEFTKSRRDKLKDKIKSLESKRDILNSEFKKAQKLYSQNIITFKELNSVESKVVSIDEQLFKINELYDKEYNITQIEESIDKSLNDINKSIERAKLRVDTLKYELNKYTIKAIHPGVVHKVKASKNEFVKSGNIILTIETTQKPFITTMVEYDYISKIHIGMRVLVYSIFEQKKYNALIESINFENGSPYGTVQLEFVDKSIELSYGSSVGLLFLR